MSATEDLLRRNEDFAAAFDTPGLSSRPGTGVAVVACMDARMLPSRILGLREGDAHVIRNAGGVLTDDVVRSLIVSQRLLGTTEIVLLHHTDCGMATFTDDELADRIEAEVGQRPTVAFGAFADADDDLRAAVSALRANPFLPHTDAIRAFVYDVGSGRLREVVAGA